MPPASSEGHSVCFRRPTSGAVPCNPAIQPQSRESYSLHAVALCAMSDGESSSDYEQDRPGDLGLTAATRMSLREADEDEEGATALRE